jgi:hypothetical protein
MGLAVAVVVLLAFNSVVFIVIAVESCIAYGTWPRR